MLLSGKILKSNKLLRLVRRGLLCCLFIAGLIVVQFTSGAVYASSPEIEEALESVYDDDDYQKALPLEVNEPKVEKKPPPPKKEEQERLDLSGLEVLGKILIYGFLALVIVWIGMALYNYLKDLKRRPQNKTVLEDKPVSYARVTDMPEELSKETLEYADQLAEKGQFEAAIRALLFCCLKHVRDSYHSTLPSAMTNREILKVDWLPSDVRQKMSVIVAAEEVTEFGGRSAGPQEFNTCREAFHVFVRSGKTGAAIEGSAV